MIRGRIKQFALRVVVQRRFQAQIDQALETAELDVQRLGDPALWRALGVALSGREDLAVSVPGAVAVEQAVREVLTVAAQNTELYHAYGERTDCAPPAGSDEGALAAICAWAGVDWRGLWTEAVAEAKRERELEGAGR